MAQPPSCSQCGAKLPANAPGQQCPLCLMQLGLIIDAPNDRTPLSPATAPKVGDRIGPYQLVQQIGQGGCGVVYLAEQEFPVRRRVALKVIKLGMDTQSVIARFEAERQALALMDHPNIAKVFDAGTTETGRPYFVMELVEGVKITDYCDQHNLSTRERLDLFIQVCRAIQHAHQKGIIHRDIKPSNTLVALHDGIPVPKVIDFGIAKAMHGKLTDETFLTAFDQFMGTPAYMSPEQAELNAQDIDTRSDIYSLGVLLYELLTGKTPFDAKDLMQAGLEEIRRIIREEEPPSPSARLNTLEGADSTNVARHRRAEMPKLVSLVRGDLDWIVMKTLEKDRARRYESASGLAADLQRHLNNEPVVARPPSARYRIQKLVRRNKLAFAAGASVAAALMVGLGLAAIGWHQRGMERDRAGRLLYAASMKLAQQAWEQGEVGWVRQLLDETKDFASLGFEWYYWQRKTHLDLKTFQGHIAPVTSVAVSPVGQRLVTGSGDNTAKVWDLVSGRELLILKGHLRSVTSVAFSPDGQLIVTGSEDKTARIWEAASGKELLALKGHIRAVTSVAFSPDGRRIVTGSEDKTARIWEVSSGKELLTIKAQTEVDILYSVQGGKWIVTRMPDGERTRKGRVLGTYFRDFEYHSHSIWSVAFSPDGRRVVTGSEDYTASVWDADSGRELVTLIGHDKDVRSVAFSQDGKRIVTGSQDNTAKVWDAVNGKEIFTINGHTNAVHSVALSHDGRWIVTGSADKSARIWDAASGKELLALRGHSAEVLSAAFSPDGQRIVTGSIDTTAKEWDATTSKDGITIKGYSNEVYSVAFSPDGQRIVTGSSGEAEVWDAASGRKLVTLIGHTEAVMSVAFSPNGQRIVTGGSEETAKVWDADTGKELFTLHGNCAEVLSAAFSPDSKRVVTGSGDENTAKVWDAASGKELLALRGHSAEVLSAAFSPNGQRIATSSLDKMAKVWDADTGNELLTLKGHGSAVSHVAFSPDGQRIVTGSLDKMAKVWDADTGKELLTLKGHTAGIRSAAFSPDCQRIVTGSDDNTAIIWESVSGKELLILKGHSRAVDSVAFSPDGQRIVTGSDDNTARVWEAPTRDRVAAWEEEEKAAMQRLVPVSKAAEKEKNADADKAAREFAELAGPPGLVPKHQQKTQNPPIIPGDPGVIRQWLVLGAIPIEGATDLNLLRQQIPYEARLHPREGEHPAGVLAGLVWKPVVVEPIARDMGSMANYIALGSVDNREVETTNQVAYAVTYIVSETTQTGLFLLVTSRQMARIYLNEREIFRQLFHRKWFVDWEVAGIELKEGLNVLVFKIAKASDGPDFDGQSVRFLNPSGRPLKGIHVTLHPEGKN